MPYIDQGKFGKITSHKEVKEVKKMKEDTSAFHGESSLSREQTRNWLRKEEAWKITKKGREERAGMEKQLFPGKEAGNFIDRKEAEKVYNELNDHPTRSKEKYQIKNEGERYKTIELLKKFLGK
jgi:hypothetical protein